ncbi:g5872 [Coccomyxa viridis]|uniref:Patatin n=1 Tax=Coccomyxa viridis TaxID=1274662 RepID=A0ABP1G0S6_9CHLO
MFGQESHDLSLTVVPPADSDASAPILSGAGGGIFFWWQLGAVKYLQERHDLTRWQMRGASAGGLVACIAACNVDPEKAYEAAHRISEENKLFERPLGLAGVWGNLVRQWLNEVLPDNAAELCRGRLKVVVTRVPSFQLTYIDDFATKEELIDACMASAHIPFFLDWRATAKYRGDRYIDGSLTDFINSNNSHLIHCDGEALILDYFQDEELQYQRFDFVKLRNPEEIQGMIRAGYGYAARLDEAGVLFDLAVW